MAIAQKTVDNDLIDSIRSNIGNARTEDLGVITALDIRRYARASGETNPLYLDREFARSNGYEDIIAPPNMLVSVLTWDEGSSVEQLRVDGTEQAGTLEGVPAEGYRLMGAGEDVTFFDQVYPGDHLTMTTDTRDVWLRESKSGPMAIAKVLRTYFANGHKVLESTQTFLIR
ncbi:MaoC family dehydratase N-terminal domain-containing protein [Brevibacterium luteolum]|uniref:MaoC family dehydratase N-terminal domain-containing protein n=1 Tax=Brevibacterium luteolum TaxID=199591 RepID=UPI00223B9A99|nr:MaoC family dehydratase N-terminal domain-containing protein [Brevibacterium luteolum]